MNGQRASGPEPFVLLTISVEMALKVLVTFEDVHNFKNIIDVAEEDHVAAKRKAASVGQQFRSCTPHLTGQCRQMTTFATKSANKISGAFRVPTFLPDISIDIIEIGSGTR